MLVLYGYMKNPLGRKKMYQTQSEGQFQLLSILITYFDKHNIYLNNKQSQQQVFKLPTN